MEGLGYTFASFLLPFCSFGFQLVLSRYLMSQSNDDFLILCFANGLYLLGLGLGSYQSQKAEDPLKRLVSLEISLVIFMQTLVVVAMVSTALGKFSALNIPFNPATFMNLSYALVVGGPLILGQISGHELPLLQRIWKQKLGTSGFHSTLTLNYVGSLFSGLAAVFIFDRFFGTFTSILILSVINLLCVLFLFKKGLFRITFCVLLTACLFYIETDFMLFFGKVPYAEIHPAIYLTWSEFYTELKKETAQLILFEQQTHYQHITLVEKPNDFLALYLDGQYQFDSRFEKAYHETFVDVVKAQVNEGPKKILILGGGDGLLVRSLLARYPEVKIDLVELDQDILQLGQSNPRLTQLNERALFSKNLQIHVQDAFQYLKNNQAKWDIILGDLPYPNSFEISKVYSVEFYKTVLDSLSADGIFIFDYPLRDSPEIAAATLNAAGFIHNIGVVNGEAFILAASHDLKNVTFENLDIHVLALPPPVHENINSIYKPRLPIIL